MRILMVIDSLDKGGKERRMLELIKGLLLFGNGIEIYLVCLTDRIEYDYVYALPITFEVLKRRYKKDFRIAVKLRRIISSFNPDIIHSWSTMASVLISVANLFSRKPFVNAVLADAPIGLNIFNKHFFRVKITVPFSDIFVSNSKAGIIAYGTPRSRSICIYNGIDFKRFEGLRNTNEVAREILGFDRSEFFIVAMVASFNERKDFKTFAHAAVELCSRNLPYIFLFVGDGETLPEIKLSVPSALIEERKIIFTGKRHDIENLLQIIDVGVLLTNMDMHGEGVSNSIIEYMSLGKPVVATRGGGTGEIITDSYNGFLIDSQNDSQLVDKIELLASNKTQLREMGENARKFALEKFDLKSRVLEYLRMYEGLMRPKQKPGRIIRLRMRHHATKMP